MSLVRKLVWKYCFVLLSLLVFAISIPISASAQVSFNEVKIYYKKDGFTKANIHFKVDNGTWTPAPGRAMSPSNTFIGYFEISLPLASGSTITAAFNNGSNVWDNNNTKNYLFRSGVSTVNNGYLRDGLPVMVRDITPPSAPEALSVSYISSSSVTLNWTASQDNLAFVAYELYRNGTMIANQTTTSFKDNNLLVGTSYTYHVIAYDYALNHSLSSNSLNVSPTQGAVTKIYYKVKNGTSAYMHYRLNGGSWTNAPGQKMQPSEVLGFHVLEVNLSTASGLEAAFNNGVGIWDNNGTLNYKIGAGTFTVSNGKITAGTPVPTVTNKITIYYKALNGANSYIHYRPEAGAWTTAPGVKMTAAEFSGFNKVTLEIGSASKIEAAFNNGTGIWDNNSWKNYLIGSGTWTLSNGVLKQGTPI